MDAEIEVLSGELVESEPPAESSGRLVERARDMVANPRVQGAAAATAGMIVGATTLALMRRVSRNGSAAALRRAALNEIGPVGAGGPGGPPIGPIQPGTYIVRIRTISTLPPQFPPPSSPR